MMFTILLFAALAIVLMYLIISSYFRSLRIGVNFGDLYVLITGCDTGFGHNCAHKLDQLGFHVFAMCLTSEKVKELSETCSKRMVALQLDVTDEQSVQEALKSVKTHLPEEKGLWAIINNAGIMGSVGIVEWLNKSHYQATLGINFLGMVSVTKAFLPLVRKAEGRIVNTASTLGRFATLPAPYAVSKFCVEAYTDILRRELATLGVSVHTIEPGGYRTNLTNADLNITSMNKVFNELNSELKEFYGEELKQRMELFTRISCYAFGGNPEEVVDTYIHAVTARYPKTRYVVGLNGNLVFRVLWTLPTWLADFLIGMTIPGPKGMSAA